MVDDMTRPRTIADRICDIRCTRGSWMRWGYALPQAIYLSFAAMANSRPGIRPTTWLGKTISVWQGAFGLIVVAAYTANLAAHLSVSPTVVEKYQTVGDL